MSWRPASRIGLGGGPLGNLYGPFYGSGLAELRLGRFLAACLSFAVSTTAMTA